MFVSVSEVSESLKLHKQTVYKLAAQKRLPHYRVGGKLLFDLNEIKNASRVQKCDSEKTTAET